MNYSLIKRELLKAIRGKHSQNYVNGKLGYSFNQVYRWEAGYKKIPWLDFVQLCRVCKVDLKAAFRYIDFFDLDPERYDILVKELVADDTLKMVGESIGCSQSQLSRWLNKKIVPTLENILKLIYVRRSRLIDFVSQLTDIHLIPSLLPFYIQEEKERELHFKYPYVAALIRVLDLKQYKGLREHSDTFVAKQLGLPEATVKEALSHLHSLKLIKIENKKAIPQSMRLHVGNNFEYNKRVRKYWTEKALEILNKLQPPKSFEARKSLLGYNVFSVSEEGFQKIKKKYLEFYNDIRAILVDDKAETEMVKVLNLQILDPSDDGSA